MSNKKNIVADKASCLRKGFFVEGFLIFKSNDFKKKILENLLFFFNSLFFIFINEDIKNIKNTCVLLAEKINKYKIICIKVKNQFSEYAKVVVKVFDKNKNISVFHFKGIIVTEKFLRRLAMENQKVTGISNLVKNF